MAKRILIVDDHVPTRALIRTILEAEKTESFEVLEAGTGTEPANRWWKRSTTDAFASPVTWRWTTRPPC